MSRPLAAKAIGAADSSQKGAAYGLPRHYYVDPDIFEREMREIFLETWQCVAHVSELPNPGDYKVYTMANEGVAVVRGKDGVIRAFHNLCAHRGHPLLSGAGHCKGAITCPYHAWSSGT